MHINHERLRELRLERMLTQGELGELAGLTLDTVNTAEAGHSISPKTARKLVTALGVERQDLLPPKDEASQKAGHKDESATVLSLEDHEIRKILADPAMREALEANISSYDDVTLATIADGVRDVYAKIEAERRRRDFVGIEAERRSRNQTA